MRAESSHTWMVLEPGILQGPDLPPGGMGQNWALGPATEAVFEVAVKSNREGRCEEERETDTETKRKTDKEKER